MSPSTGSAKLLRAMNESAALGHLLDGGHFTRADLCRRTALSTPTISEVLRRRTAVGLVAVVGHDSGGPGRRAEIYGTHPDGAYALAVVSKRHQAGGKPDPLRCQFPGASQQHSLQRVLRANQAR